MVRSSSDYDSPVEHTLVRSPPVLPAVQSSLRDDGIGYVDADVLGAEQVDQVAAAIKSLESQGATKLILDLRGNALGTPEEGIALANLLIDEGPITTLKGQNFSEKAFNASPDTTVTSLPIAVIVDRPTAGGAEIAAAAIQQSKRGEVVGEGTSGLAALQETISLDDGAALILSVANYHGPGGEAIHNEGVEPDRIVTPRALRRYRDAQRRVFDSPEAQQKAAEEAGDPFLDKAIEVLGGSV